MLWNNNMPSSPPMLKRSTHLYCDICFTNLEEYGQKKCNGCLLSLEEEGMVNTNYGKVTGVKGLRRIKLFITSKFRLFMRFMNY